MSHSTQSAVRCVEDIAFAQVINETGQLETLHLDLYLPEHPPAEPLRTIVLFHGGGFKVGNDKRQFYIQRFAKVFAAAGYACVAPDYRVRQDPGDDYRPVVRDALADARQALEWVRQKGPRLGLDPTNLVLGGGSAGGILTTNLVHDPQQPLALTDHVYAVLNLWGPPTDRAILFETANPACPPTFIVHGTADQLVDYKFSQQLVQKLEAAGVPYRLLTLPGAPHTPVREHGDQIEAEMLAFLEQNPKPPLSLGQAAPRSITDV
jgi:acetyl esterase/lipase